MMTDNKISVSAESNSSNLGKHKIIGSMNMRQSHNNDIQNSLRPEVMKPAATATPEFAIEKGQNDEQQDA